MARWAAGALYDNVPKKVRAIHAAASAMPDQAERGPPAPEGDPKDRSRRQGEHEGRRPAPQRSAIQPFLDPDEG